MEGMLVAIILVILACLVFYILQTMSLVSQLDEIKEHLLHDQWHIEKIERIDKYNQEQESGRRIIMILGSEKAQATLTFDEDKCYFLKLEAHYCMGLFKRAWKAKQGDQIEFMDGYAPTTIFYKMGELKFTIHNHSFAIKAA